MIFRVETQVLVFVVFFFLLALLGWAGGMGPIRETVPVMFRNELMV